MKYFVLVLLYLFSIPSISDEVIFSTTDEPVAVTPAENFVQLKNKTQVLPSAINLLPLECKKVDTEGNFCFSCFLEKKTSGALIIENKEQMINRLIDLSLESNSDYQHPQPEVSIAFSKILKKAAHAFYELYKNNFIETSSPLTLDNFYKTAPKLKTPSVQQTDLFKAYNYLTKDYQKDFPSSWPKNSRINPNELLIALLQMSIIYVITDPPCGMTTEEYFSISNYTTGAFASINTYLRNRNSLNRNHGMDEFIDILNQSLKKIEPFNGYVIRNTKFMDGSKDMPEKIYREHAVGKTVNYPAFTSTSIQTGFGGNMVIYSKTGVLVDAASRSRGEGEVLFPTDTNFRVLYNSCEENKLKRWQDCNIIMEEVPK